MACEVAACMPWTRFRDLLRDSGPKSEIAERDAAAADGVHPSEACHSLAQSIEALTSSEPDMEAEDVELCLRLVLGLINGRGEDSRLLAIEVAERLLEDDTPAKLVACLDRLGFEARKQAMRTFGAVLKAAPSETVVEYMRERPSISQMLLEGSGNSEVFICCSNMLRACSRNAGLVEVLLRNGATKRLIDLARCENFDISSEAFASLRDLLTAHPATSAAFLQENFGCFFEDYHVLLQADNYATRRQALRLLSEVLLDRALMEIMVKYVSKADFLQIHMNLLRDGSRAIQIDTFHVFKIFAANPNKPRRVQQILFQNKDRLIKFLKTTIGALQNDKVFNRDLETVIRVLGGLEAPSKLPSGLSSP
mmetsp:Transcript_82772/g.146192  ORF Transcript_82772/g.146192 Transcript_82772/m.146192 type:complete len:366 (+) Transcript_82772:119-1216(+)|eukprot:CAMPEP_0197692258 /NCGR_PEP_ID=MMETSP1338-20131121/110828_1 /TAXON_ID=43686 ORGANISM="Pelagodinium beii, Strain RCC1491" /NCGR_SAMPLE_ID=MMETSP1338 /ASSEMBLY_ACC=CAM_ASM_000754 /LENGTH=365 /DNA_ID=CAMNT_0043274893 /DNA_START=80 /DNA_END=1177 /DNA_ORIENTATION=+